MYIIIENLSHVYGRGTPFEKKALHDVNVHIPSGTFVCVIGATGSGKSTLIQHINGLLLPTEGTICVGDTRITPTTKPAVIASLRQKVGMVFQYPETQLFEATVLQDVMYGPLQFGLDPEQAKQKALTALQNVGLDGDEISARSPFALSGGQMRRVAIAGVLASGSEVLILDEPVAGLDPRGKKDILGLVATMHGRSHRTTILVTHHMEDVARYADLVLVMHRGTVVMQGTPRQVFSQHGTLREYGLELPPVIRWVNRFNQVLKRPLPETILTMEELVAELDRRKKEGNEHP